ncbi:DMT family transporter [Rhodocyclus gracilis]|uniref:EamA family transporter n=1 Tax=Rhodocyclus tenuis TaxID=1066 RepID=A0A6L5JX29_RHOTE|nr:DMT family transporter [Rhodocyclus gracilis]MQY51905.1 EamA family transporter [Rhodocyclus gracilis]
MSALQPLLPYFFVVLWSTGFIGARFGLPHAEPLTFLLVRFLLAMLLLGGIAVLARAPWPKDLRLIAHLAVAGMLLHGVYLGGVFAAIGHGLPAGVTALVVGVQPLLTAVSAFLLRQERVSARQWLGLAAGFIGVTLVLSSKLGASASFDVMLVPALIALFAITAGTLYQKRFCPHFDLRTGSAIQFAAAAALMAIGAAASESMVIDWTPEFTFALGWLVVALSVGAISLLNVLIRRGSAVNVASLFYLTPPITAVFAWLLFDERLNLAALCGMLLTAGGVYLARQTSR